MVKPDQIVIDRENPDDRLVVQAISSDSAREWLINEINKTVAEVNPEYSGDDRVVHASYLLQDGETASEKTYSFPESRLKSI